MPKNIKISIPKPCHEDRNKMLPTSNGYFCNSCEKEVIDFRNFSDDDIQLFFKKMDSNSTCGIFNAPQLVFPDFEAKSYTFNKYFTRFGFGAMAILSSLLAQAQVTKPKKVETFISPKIDKKIAITFPLIITGKVVYDSADLSMGIQKGEPVIGATVSITKTVKGTTCDMDGKFRLIINESDFKNDSLVIEIQYFGFNKENVILIKNNITSTNFNIKLKVNEIVYDKVVYDGYRTIINGQVTSKAENLNIISDTIKKLKSLCLPKQKITTSFPLKISGTITFADNDAAFGVKKGEGAISADIGIENANLKFKITDIDGNFDLILHPEYFINDECKITISYLNTVFDTIILNQTKPILSYYNIALKSNKIANTDFNKKYLFHNENVTIYEKSMGMAISTKEPDATPILTKDKPSNETNYVSFEHPKPIETVKITGKIKEILELIESKSVNPDSVKSILLVRANEYFQVVEIDKNGEFCLDYPQSKSAIEPISISFYSKILPSKEFVITKDELLKNNILKIK